MLTDRYMVRERLREVMKYYQEKNLREFAEAPYGLILFVYRKIELESVIFVSSDKMDTAFETEYHDCDMTCIAGEIDMPDLTPSCRLFRDEDFTEVYELAKRQNQCDTDGSFTVSMEVCREDFHEETQRYEFMQYAIERGNMKAYVYPIINSYEAIIAFKVLSVADYRAQGEDDVWIERYYTKDSNPISVFHLQDSAVAKQTEAKVMQMICDSVPGDYLFQINKSPIQFHYMKEPIITRDKMASITLYKGNKESGLSIQIPERINEYLIFRIGPNCFKNMVSLQNVIFSKHIRFIEMDAFRNCKELTELTIPASVERIGAQAFANCEKLQLYMSIGEERAKEMPYYPWGLKEEQIHYGGENGRTRNNTCG